MPRGDWRKMSPQVCFQQNYETKRQYKSHIQYYKSNTRMWANAQPDGRPAEHRWRPLFNAAKFG